MSKIGRKPLKKSMKKIQCNVRVLPKVKKELIKKYGSFSQAINSLAIKDLGEEYANV